MQVTLQVTAGPHQGRTFIFRDHDTFIVGRASYAHFRLEARDKYFSRAHFLIEVNPPLCRLIDMGSTNGTSVNGAKVNEVDLKDGDRIQGGKTVLTVGIERSSDEDATAASVGGAGGAVRPGVSETRAHDGSPRIVGDHPGTVGAAKAPARIAQYRLVRELGRGGMGVVYLAKRDTDQSYLAIKTIQPKVEITPRDLDRFLREASILEALDHPGIVRFLESGEFEGQVYLAMEYVDGINLSTAIKRSGMLPIARASALICQLLEAIHYAHDRGVLHRDIKPGNVLLSGTAAGERVKLADFGLARVYRESRLSGLTLQGEMGGTIAFAAPEQITNFREAKPASDIYSAGATLYMMLTGRHVYDFPNAFNRQVLMILQEEPVQVGSRRPDVPQDLSDVIHQALARKPEERFPNAESMRLALLPFAR
jgi:eukaryotic-like serine/threonine-protein kinase